MESQKSQPVAKVRMLIRRPASQVFHAITTPQVLEQFWLARASGPLEPLKTVRWDFLVPGVSEQTTVKQYEQDRRVLLEWSDGTVVDWQLEARRDGHTTVEVCNSGFKGTYAEIVEQALEATQGFTIVMCDLKTLLEHGQPLNLSRDKAQLIQEKEHAI